MSVSEQWSKTVQQERAYTDGWRAQVAGEPCAKAEQGKDKAHAKIARAGYTDAKAAELRRVAE